jgi:hypothetical protein
MSYDNIVIPTIAQGLGNRLFKLANAISYATKYNKKLILCSKYYDNNNVHSDIDYTDIFFKDIPLIDYDELPRDIRKYDEFRGMFIRYMDIPNIQNVLLSGYFQSYKYFESIKDIIYNRFRCPLNYNNLIREKYNIDNGCFIHIRRGDYNNSKYDILLGTKYYEWCINYMSSVNKDVIFYIISNDMEWCKNNNNFINLKNCVYVNDNELECLWLMELCKVGGICANSTFSWWGGWLNKYRYNNSIILFPNRLFDITERYDYSDFIHPTFKIVNIDSL